MSRSEFESLLQTEGHPPVVFHHAVDQWPAMQWTEQYLAEQLQGKQFQCKISPECHEEVLMETECLHVECTLQQYVDWLSRQQEEDSPLSLFDPSKYACYVDYKYMKDMFKDSPEVLKEVSWEVFGFPGRDGAESTIWIGSMGAYTPCHQDTYGFNLVAQIKGCKRWYLFPPAATSHMYPSRVPYEESSVFSEINVRNPDLKKHPLFQGAEPYIVILQPGDVLYVPRHWWHFVECLETSISVNTWVEMEEDVHTHLHEAVTRFLFTSMADNISADCFLNTYEEIEPSPINIDYIKQALQTVINHEKTRTKEQSEETDGEQPVLTSETDIQTTHDKHLKIKSAELQADQSGCKILQSTTVNNFSKFSNAFKGHMVSSCRRGFDKICSDKTRQRERKRHHPSSQLGGDDQNICGHLLEDCGTGACLKYAKLEHGFMKKKIVSISCEGDGQDINSGKTNTEKKGLQIFTVSKLSFWEYLVFLKKEFDYDDTEYGSVDSSKGHDDENKIVDTSGRDSSVVAGSSSGNAVSVFDENTDSISSGTTYSCVDSCTGNIDADEQKRIKRSRRDDAKSYSIEDDGKNCGQNDRFALQVINSVLDHTVVSGVCQNLLKKYKD